MIYLKTIISKINIKISAFLFIILDVILTLFILLYPMKNGDLTLQFIMEQNPTEKELILGWGDESAMATSSVKGEFQDGIASVELESGVALAELPFYINISEDVSVFTKLRIYRDGILVRTMEPPEIETFVDRQSEQKNHMNSGFNELLSDLSTTRIIERGTSSLAALTGILILFGLLCIAQNRIRHDLRGKNNLTRFFKDIKEYAYFAWYSAKTDLKAEVANSYLNWVWWILEPLCNMLVYYFIFGKIYGNTTPYFIVFIYSGLLMWNFYNRTIIYSIKLVRSNKEIVTRVYIPKFVILISNMILNGIKLLISIGILAVMMFIYRVPVNITLFYFVLAYVGLFLFTFGCGTILLHLGVFIDDLAYAIGIMLNMLFFLSGVFYDVETAVAAPFGLILKVLNPIAMYIGAMRDALLYETVPNLALLGVWLVLSVTLCCFGANIIYKYENSYVKVV